MARTRRGDKDAFAALVRKYEGQVYAVAYARLLNVADAEDVVQETFLQAYRALHQLRMPDRFGGWIARIALSFAVKRLRARTREPITDVGDLLSNTPDPATAPERFERGEDARALIEAALASLPDSLREPFVMRHVAEASYDAIAEALLVAPRTAERRVQRARERLHRYLAARGLQDIARDALLSGALMPTAADGAFRAVMRAVTPEPTPSASDASASHRYVPAVAASALIVCGLFAGVGMLEGRLRAAEGKQIARPVVLVRQRATRIASVGRSTPLRERAALMDIPPGAVAILREDFEALAPGQSLPGWSRGVHAQTTHTRPGGGSVAGAVTTNIPSAYFRFPRVRGVLTIDVWLKPHPGDSANCGIRIGHDGRTWGATDTPIVDPSGLRDGAPQSYMPIHKDDTGQWFYRIGDAPVPIAFAAYDGDWHHVRVRHDTDRGEYSLYLDGDLVRARIPSPALFPEGVSFVALNSGRWMREQDKPSYFDDLSIYIEPAEDWVTLRD